MKEPEAIQLILPHPGTQMSHGVHSGSTEITQFIRNIKVDTGERGLYTHWRPAWMMNPMMGSTHSVALLIPTTRNIF